MARIAVDIDSTLYDFETPAREAFLTLAEKYNEPSYRQGAYHPWTEWRSPTDVCGLEIWLEAIALCHEADAILQQVPFAGSVDTCQALQEEGHHLLYISNRATEAQDATEQWLEEWGFLGANTNVLALTGDKKPHMAACQYLIDDRLKTCVEFVYDYEYRRDLQQSMQTKGIWPDEDRDTFIEANKRRAFVKAYQYNQAATDVPGLYLAPTWSGLNIYLEKHGVLSERAAFPTLKV